MRSESGTSSLKAMEACSELFDVAIPALPLECTSTHGFELVTFSFDRALPGGLAWGRPQGKRFTARSLFSGQL